MDRGESLIKLESISKRFGGVQALCEVSFSVEAGEVHAVVGENGAGKSTLMNVLAGVYRPDGGKVFLRGEETQLRDPRDAQRHRISIVYQELNLFPDLSVGANIFAGRERRRVGGLLNEAEMRQEVRKVLDLMDVDLSPDEKVGQLSMGKRQLVEISRALAHDAEIIIMDEPNSALTARESEVLFGITRRLRDQGLTVLYISHRLEEVFTIADRVSVLHNGSYVGTWRTGETTIPEIVHAMTGGISIKESVSESRSQVGEPLLSVEGLGGAGGLVEVSATARRGEVVGLAGLEGSGITEFFEIIFGLQPRQRGRILVRGRETAIHSPTDAIKLGIALVPANRRDEGLMMDWNLRENVSLVVLERMAKGPLLDPVRIDAIAQEYVDLLKVATDSTRKLVVDLSGGNQQKVAIAKWLATQADILLLNDPARGIDVATKAEIFALARDMAAAGKTVLLTSSDVTEIVDVCDRVLIFYKGTICGELERGQATKQIVLEMMMRGSCTEPDEPRPVAA